MSDWVTFVRYIGWNCGRSEGLDWEEREDALFRRGSFQRLQSEFGWLLAPHIALERVPFLPRIDRLQSHWSPSRSAWKMATIDLDNIQFYSPNPPPSRPCGTLKPISSTDISMGNRPVCTPPSAFLALSRSSTETNPLENPFTSLLAPALPESTIQPSKSPRAVQTDFNRVLEELGVAEIETVDLTGDDSLDSLLNWVSEKPCRSPSPGGSFHSLEGMIFLSPFLSGPLALCMWTD